MKTSHKQFIRAFIVELLGNEDVRHRLDALSDSVKLRTGEDLDPFDAIQFYEQEVSRIEKLFNYPELPS